MDLVDAGAGVSKVSFSTEPTHTYQLESASDLTTWTAWGTPAPTAAATSEANLPRTGSRRFWRARMQP